MTETFRTPCVCTAVGSFVHNISSLRMHQIPLNFNPEKQNELRNYLG